MGYLDTRKAGEAIIDTIIRGGLVKADLQEPSVLIWSANAPEQIGEVILRMLREPAGFTQVSEGRAK